MINVRDKPTKFAQIPRTHIFAANMTLYTKTDGEEKSEMHYLQKIGPNKAMTLDKSTLIYFAADDSVHSCSIVHNSVGVKQAS